MQILQHFLKLSKPTIFYALSSLGLKHPKQGIMKGPFTRRWGDSGSKINQRQNDKETHLCAKSLSFLSVLDSGSTHRVTLTPHLHSKGQKCIRCMRHLQGSGTFLNSCRMSLIMFQHRLQNRTHTVQIGQIPGGGGTSVCGHTGTCRLSGSTF